ncbi:MAG: hypothetical protein Ta2F_05860 [Termitinemataceae bacterium]|nr:MAG: hypothetical protein Ta2F_05860 [Termitinemataceae bacterium]
MLYSLQAVLCVSLFSYGVVNIANIKNQFTQISAEKESDVQKIGEGGNPEITLSKTARNVLIMMLDRGVSDYVPYIFEERPDIENALKGFTYYPNTVSFSGNTFLSTPSLFGGYEYTPKAINDRSGEPLVNKYLESYTMLPKLFAANNFNVTLINMPIYESKNLKNHKKLTFDFTEPNIQIKKYYRCLFWTMA